MIYQNLPAEVINEFARCQSITLFTGAGISIEAGVPSYRGVGRFGYFHRLPADYLSTKTAWLKRPAQCLEFFNNYRMLIQRARPGIAHQTIHGWQLRRFAPAAIFPFTLITQNFDGLHQWMGNEDVIELHGSIWRLRCDLCRRVLELAPFRHLKMPQRCPDCDGMLRPDIRLVDEEIAHHIHHNALSAAEENAIFMSIGVSGVTRYSALLANAAKRKGRYLIEINLQPTPLSELFHATILAPAAEILPQFYWDYLANDMFIV